MGVNFQDLLVYHMANEDFCKARLDANHKDQSFMAKYKLKILLLQILFDIISPVIQC